LGFGKAGLTGNGVKKSFLPFSLVLILFFSLLIVPRYALGDVGDFNDYSDSSDSSDSGWSSSDWGSSDSDWSSSSDRRSGRDRSSDSDGRSSDRSSGSSGGGSLSLVDRIIMFIIVGGLVGIFIGYPIYTTTRDTFYPQLYKPIIMGIIKLFRFLKRKRSSPSGSAVTPAVRDHTGDIVTAILKIDPKFSNDKFIAWAKEVFFTLQYAWMDRDWERVRPFEKEELYKQHEMQLQQYINSGRINVLERININQGYLQKYVRDRDYEYLTVFFQVRMTDYIKDEKTGKVLKGSPNVDSHMKYLYTFMRKNGVLTNPATSNKNTTNCPNCAAPTKITSAGKCEYCNSIITTGTFDWVLSNIDGVKPQTVIDDSGVIIRDGRK